AALGEGALWSAAEQALYWVDITRPTLNRFDPASGVNTSWPMPSPIGCFALCPQGGAVVALCEGFHHFDLRTGALRLIADPEPHKPGNRFNDGTVDPRGRFWAGTMPIAGPGEAPEGGLYCLDLDGGVRQAEGAFWIQNGLAFSPDGRTMYVSDSYAPIRTIWAFDYDPDSGVPANRRLFFDTRSVAGRPDGAAMDADGCYWMAGVGGWQLVRLTPQGQVDRIIPMPVEKPTKIAFGGRNLDIMYVTSIGQGADPADPAQREAGNLFAVHAGVQGLPVPGYAGAVAPPP
ncbi:MAG: SMP-30/gluconolactonase/LRE family protein, partial [Pseudomonadota bacterium]|nr:SMP-30/gluconolactonase/LRE family protein [Pseudomonadota bacterium]